MRSRGRPISSARAPERSPDCTIASRITAPADSGSARVGVLVHQAGQKLLVERAPVHADADRLPVFDRHLDDGAELPVALFAETDVAGIDAILVERLGAGRMIGEKLVADIVEVADQRHLHPHFCEPVADMRNGRRRLVAVDGDADQLRAGAGERGDLLSRPLDVGRVGIGHRLDDDRRAAADHHAADIDADGVAAGEGRGRDRLGSGRH